MCYSAEVSFLTWGFALTCAVVLTATGQPLNSFAFPLVVSQMQLVEGLRWIHAAPDSVLAPLAKLVLYAQPVAGLYEAGQTQWVLPYVVAQGIAEIVGGSRDSRFVVAADGHLSWKWLPEIGSPVSFPYWIGVVFVAYTLFPLWVNAILSALLVYYVAGHSQYKTWGSLWCVSVNLLWIYYLLR